jgi:hypothetical protein
MKTIKTISLLLAAVSFVGYLLLGSTFGRVVDTAWRNTSEAAEAAIPLQFELDMLEADLDDAGGDLEERRQRVAELTVACEDLRREILSLEDQESRSLARLREVTSAYEATGFGVRPAVHGGEQLMPVRTAADLRVASAKTQQIRQGLELKRELLARREAALEQGQAAIASFAMRRQELQIALESRRMDLESTVLIDEVAIVPSADGALGQVEDRLSEVGRRIRVARVAAESRAQDPSAVLPDVPAEDVYRQALAVLEQARPGFAEHARY